MFLAVFWNVADAFPAFDQDELIGLFNDRLFIFQQYNVAVRRDNVRERFCRTERTRSIRVDDVLGLLASDLRIKMGEVHIHRYSMMFQ